MSWENINKNHNRQARGLGRQQEPLTRRSARCKLGGQGDGGRRLTEEKQKDQWVGGSARGKKCPAGNHVTNGQKMEKICPPKSPL